MYWASWGVCWINPEFGRCSLFPSWSGYGLISTPSYTFLSLPTHNLSSSFLQLFWRCYWRHRMCALHWREKGRPRTMERKDYDSLSRKPDGWIMEDIFGFFRNLITRKELSSVFVRGSFVLLFLRNTAWINIDNCNTKSSNDAFWIRNDYTVWLKKMDSLHNSLWLEQ